MTIISPGTVFGSLTAVRAGPNDASRNRTVVCRCTCGKETTVRQSNLLRGDTLSCGCQKARYISENRATHGMNGTYVYHVWQAMKKRCYYPKAINYADYGGRGITVCDRWKDSFENFYADMGNPPSEDHSIERENTNGNYEPGNCSWATRVMQQNNRRNTVLVTHEGRIQGLSEWARELGIARSTLIMRRKRGWTDAEMLTGNRIARP